MTALEMSGADAVMIGRGAQGQPWLPGQIGRRIETGIAESTPSLAEQLGYIRALYDEVCRHYGLRIGPSPRAQAISAGRSRSRRNAAARRR